MAPSPSTAAGASSPSGAPAPAHSQHTVWVRGLPESCTVSDLHELFKPFGTVRRAFFAGRKGKKGSPPGADSAAGREGAAFVNLEEAPAAAEAVQQLNKKKVLIRDKNVKLAVKLARRRERGKPEKPNTASAASADVMAKVAASAQREHAAQKKRKSAGGSLIDELVAESRAHDEQVETGTHKTFSDSDDDGKSDSESSSSSDSDSGSGSGSGSSSDSDSDSDSSAEGNVDADGDASMASAKAPAAEKTDSEKLRAQLLARPDQLRRIIIRNLAFGVTEADIKKACEPFGVVEDVQLPKKPNDAKKIRGFAFVRFRKIADAEAAVEKLNSQKLKGRVVAVDRALPKDAFQNIQGTKGEQKELATEKKSVGGDGDGDVDATMAEQPNEVKTPVTGPDGDVDEQKTLFLQNLPHDVTRGDIVNALMPYIRAGRRSMRKRKIIDPDESPDPGARPQPVSHVYLTKDPLTNVGRGTAFAKLATAVLAGVTLDALNHAANSGLADLPPFAIAGRQVKAQLAVDRRRLPGGKLHGLPLASKTVPDSVVGEELDGDAALDQFAKNQRELESERRLRLAAKHVQDKRNLYLSNEGLITPQDAASMGLSEADVEKRVTARKDKKLKLATPNFSVSRTRLSVRNLPKTTDEKTLRRVFTQQAKVGLLAGLADNVHLRADPVDASIAERCLVDYSEKDPETGKVKRKMAGRFEVSQVKVLRDASNIDSTSQRATSKGIAFVEFSDHHAALAALRSVNNNPELFGGRNKRPIVEFAVDDARKLQTHRARVEKSRAHTGEVMTSNWGKQQRADEARADASARKSTINEDKRRQIDLKEALSKSAPPSKKASRTRRDKEEKNEKVREKRKRSEDKLDQHIASAEQNEVSANAGKPVRRSAKRRRQEEEREFADMVDKHQQRKAGVNM